MASYKIIKFKGSDLPKHYQGMVAKQFRISLRHGNDYFKMIDPGAYYDVYPKYIATIIQRPTSIVKMAVLSDDEDVALGWALIEPRKVHYVYVKPEYRRIHIGQSLISEPFDCFSHITNIGREIWPDKFPQAIFNPFA